MRWWAPLLRFLLYQQLLLLGAVSGQSFAANDQQVLLASASRWATQLGWAADDPICTWTGVECTPPVDTYTM